MEELRSKCHNELLNSSAWAKEKLRLEVTLKDLSSSREGAVNAHNVGQAKIASLLSQVRSLRTSMNHVTAEKDIPQNEKRVLKTRLKEADVAIAAVEKLQRAEALAFVMQKEIATERESNAILHKDEAALEKSVKGLHGRVVDWETKGYSSASQDVKFLNCRVLELEQQLEAHESQHATSLRSVRNVDRTVLDLHTPISRRDKQLQSLTEDLNKGREKISRLLTTMDELQAEARSQLAARRAERNLREEKKKALRLERELEGWKGLRMEPGVKNGGISGGLLVLMELTPERWL